MKTIIYKKRGKCYECTSISQKASSECKIIFEEPIDGKIKLGELVLDVVRGVAAFQLCDVKNGEYAPFLVKGGTAMKMESLIFKDGHVARPMPSEEYVRELSRRIEECAELILSLEERISELEAKIENTIDF